MSKHDAKIMMEIGFSFGMGEVESSTSAFVRVYNKVANEGKPVGKINHLFFNDFTESTSLVRNIGSLCYTFSERLLYFPALVQRLALWTYSEKDGFEDREFLREFVDHITIDKDFKKGHIRVMGKGGEKASKWPTFPALEWKNAQFLFGLSLKDGSVLEPTPRKLRWIFSVPDSDVKRRVDIISRAKEGSQDHLITLNEGAMNDNEFLHLEFLIGPDNLDISKLPNSVPNAMPIVKDYVLPPSSIGHIRGHPVSIAGVSDKVWIVASKHTGKLTEEAILVVGKSE